jgi:hypothetical protein
LEGTDIFQVVGQDLLYSRRIGRGVGMPQVGPGETILDAPRTTDIGFAAKYTAKTSGGLNFGLLGASVEPARAEMLDAAGDKFERETHPLSNFGVMRAKKLLDKRGSFIGGFASYTRQAGNAGREALVAAIDGIYKSKDLSATVQVSIARSDAGGRDTGGEEGHRTYIYASRRWDSGLSLQLSAVDASRAFDPNDAGYLSRADQRKASPTVARNVDQRWWVVRNYTGEIGATASTDQAAVTTELSAKGRVYFNFMNFWYLSCEGGVNLPAYDDRELRTFMDQTKKYLRTEERPFLNLYADTALNKPYYARVSWNRTWFEGGPSDNIALNHIIRPHPAFEIKLGTGYTEQDGERRYMETAQDAPVTGLRRLSAVDQTLRLSYAFDPNLTVQFYSQWLIGTGSYRDYVQYAGDDALGDWAGAPSCAADSSRGWTVNLITRWEFRPGSTAYLVYTHGASTDQVISQNGSLSPWRDASLLHRLQSDDAVQLKVSWMFR